MSDNTAEVGKQPVGDGKVFTVPALPVGYSDELEKNVNAFISEFDGVGDQVEADLHLSVGADAVLNDDAVFGSVKPPKEAEEAVEEEVVEEEDKGLQRLAAREAEVRQKEVDFDKKLAEAIKAKLATAVPDFKGKGTEDILKHFGVDPDLALKELMLSRVADDHPLKAKLQGELKDYQYRKELDSVKAELQRRDRQAEEAKYFKTIDDGAREYVVKADEKVTPIFALVDKTKSDLVHRKMMQVIVEDAKERLSKGEDGEPLAYPEALKKLKAQYDELTEIFGGKKGTAAKPGSAVAAKPAKVMKPSVTTIEDDDPNGVQNGIKEAVKTFWLAEKAAGRVK